MAQVLNIVQAEDMEHACGSKQKNSMLYKRKPWSLYTEYGQRSAIICYESRLHKKGHETQTKKKKTEYIK